MSSSKILELLGVKPIPVREILGVVREAALASDQHALPAVLRLARMSGVSDDSLAVPAVCALPAWGDRGLDELVNILRSGHYSDVALRVLLHLAMASYPPTWIDPDDWGKRLGYEPSHLRDGAWKRLRKVALAQTTDRRLRRKLVSAASLLDRGEQGEEVEDLFWSLLTESPLSISEDALREFRELLESATVEQQLHEFLEENPVLLDATAVEVISKHRLGTEFVTDFVLRRVNNEYVLVEIEKSTDRLFAGKGRVHSQLSDALAQVRDFQRWIHNNLAYARTKLPDITRPQGLVVIGRSSELTPELREILDEENYSRRGHIEILTYDDLVERAEALFSNLIAPPQTRKGPIRRA